MTLRRFRAAFLAASAVLLAIPAIGSAKPSFDPSQEFGQDRYIDLNFGSIDLSINKAVIYLLLSTLILCVGGLVIVKRGLRARPGRGQNFAELAYEFAEGQIGRATLPDKAFPTWFPYLATLFLFIAVNNLISFIPLPISSEKGGLSVSSLPDFGLYAATANINVTLTLAAITFLATHIVGVRAHGVGGYLKTLVPDAPRAVKPFIFVIEILSQLLRLVSLSVRLFANLLAGHLLIIMAAGFVVLVGSYIGIVAIPFALFFYVFEWVLVAGLQAFIFALLSGIYIGYAIEAPH
jgi:F-type H+-transporting ATPase subunit a